MKRAASVLLVFLLILTIAAPAVFAEAEAPVISFSSSGQSVYSGMDYTVTVEASQPIGADVTVTFTGQGQTCTAVIKSGEQSVSVDMAGISTDGTSTVDYRLEEGSGYTVGKRSTHTVTVGQMPSFTIYQDFVVPRAGEEGYVAVECSKASLLTVPVPLSLRCDDGTVLCTYEYSAGKASRYISFIAPEEYDPQGSIHLYNEITGEKLDSVGVALVKPDSKMIRTVESDDKIAISFDCAYGAQYIDFILDTLDKYNAKATFFMTGFFARENPDAVRKIAERGHELGNHTNTHQNINAMSMEDIYNELRKVDEVVAEATGGQRTTIFRPPFGACDATSTAVVNYYGLDAVRWSAETVDYEIDYDYEEAIRNVTENCGAGDIILFHASATHTEKTLDACFQDYLDKGLQIVTVSDLLLDDNYIVTEEGHQIPDPSRAYATDEELLAGRTFEIAVDGGEVSSLPLTPVFTGQSILQSAADIDALKNGSAEFECSYDVSSVSAPVSEGDKVCAAELSYNGEVWFAVELCAAQSVGTALQADTDEDTDTAVSDEEALPVTESTSCTFTGAVFSIAASLVLLATAALTVFIISKRNSD